MGKERYRDQGFMSDTRVLIECTESILDEYQAAGYSLTLRQVYYQMIARDLFPDSWIDREYNLRKHLPKETKNTPKNYQRFGGIVTNAKYAGILDWDAIEDRAREVIYPGHWENPASILRSAAYSFRLDRWKDQDNVVVVMVEKQALEGILIPVCATYDVRFSANKGYASGSHLRSIAKMFIDAEEKGKNPVLLYLGDHDPSGIDMTRDVGARLREFSDGSLDVRRLALNRDQVDVLNPPENPAKTTDSRAKAYIEEHGESSWELDAIEPRALGDLVTDAIVELINWDRWEPMIERENAYKAELNEIAGRY